MNARETLDRIKTQLAAATPGPWVAHDLSDEVYSPDDNTGWWWVWQESKLPYYGAVIEPTDRSPNDGSIGVAAIDDNRTGTQEKADAVFIAAAPATVARLTAAIEAVLAVADDLQTRGDAIDEKGHNGSINGHRTEGRGIGYREAQRLIRNAIETALTT